VTEKLKIKMIEMKKSLLIQIFQVSLKLTVKIRLNAKDFED